MANTPAFARVSGFLANALALAGLILAPASVRAQAVQPMQFNETELIEMAAQGVIMPPVLREIYRVGADGVPRVYPGTGSITYNLRTGDSALNIAGDHVEPAVSVSNPGPREGPGGWELTALNVLSNIGNRARVLTGPASGSEGWVIGKHGGPENVLVDFSDDVYDKLSIGDRIQIRTIGTGMRLLNVDGIAVFNVSPDLLRAFNAAGAGVTPDGKLRIGVTHRVPAKIMGSGLGLDNVHRADYDITLFDEPTVREFGLDSLRIGDIVALIDADHSYGRIYRTGAISIGVIVHSRSMEAGHGPGVVTLFSSRDGRIEPVIDADSNLVNLLDIR